MMTTVYHKLSLRTAVAAALACAVPATLIAVPSTVSAQSNAQANARLDQVAEALRGISTLRANFTQTDRGGQVLSGQLALKRPGKIRFAYDDVNMLIVSDGSSLNFIDYSVQQRERWPISDSPLGALLDPQRDVQRYGRLMATADPNVVSVEVADPARPEFGRINLIMVRNAAAPGGLELASWVALDSQNRRTTVRLSDHRYGVSVPDSEFRFRDPRRTTRRPG